MLKSMQHAKEQSPVSHRNYNIGRDAVKLLINLINVGFSSLIEERIVNMVSCIQNNITPYQFSFLTFVSRLLLLFPENH